MHSCGQSGLRNFLINNAYLCVFFAVALVDRKCKQYSSNDKEKFAWPMATQTLELGVLSLWVGNQNRKQHPSNMPTKQKLSSIQKTLSTHRIQITKAQAALCDEVHDIARVHRNVTGMEGSTIFLQTWTGTH